MPYLPFLLLLPLVGALLIMFLPRESKGAIRAVSVATAILTFGYTIFIAYIANWDTWSLQFTTPIIDTGGIQINFALGVDALSILMVLLNALLFVVALIVSLNIENRVREYHAMFLLLEMAVFGVFIATDLFMFYIFWELILIPMFFIIAVWGGKNRQRAAIKFILFTLGGSLLMLVGIIGYYMQPGASFDLTHPGGLIGSVKDILFWLVFIGLAVKIPLFPFHTWLPDAHTEAPTAGSIILAGILLKMGTYGFLRVLFPLFPEASRHYALFLAIIGVINIIYGAFLAMSAKDIKRIIACSSISHMGFVVLALAALSEMGFAAGTLQMINHGIVSAGLFLLVGVLYDRTHRRGIDDFGGLFNTVPFYFGITLLIVLASIGLPGLNCFVSEFTCLLAAFQVEGFQIATVIATLGIVLGAVYMLNLVQKVFSGPLNEKWKTIPDIDAREAIAILPLCFLVIFLGVAPGPIFKLMAGTMSRLSELF